MLRKVDYAQLHGPAFVKDIGQIPKELSNIKTGSKTLTYDMWYGANKFGAEGLHVRITGPKGIKKDLTFPPGAIALVSYAELLDANPDAPKAAKATEAVSKSSN